MKKKKCIAYLLSFIFCIGLLSPFAFSRAIIAAPAPTGGTPPGYIETFQITDDSYLLSLQAHPFVRPDDVIVIEGADFLTTTADNPVLLTDFEGEAGVSLLTGETDIVTWAFEVPTTGFYNIRVHYFPVEGRSASIERPIRVNGEIPFRNAVSVTFPRIWSNETNDFVVDIRGNEIRPRQVENPMWVEIPVLEPQGYFNDPLLFHFTEGTNTLTLESLREPMLIRRIVIYNEPDLIPYAEIAVQNAALGRRPANTEMILIDGARAAYKSSPALFPISDRSSPASIPYSVNTIVLNAIGGTNWTMPNDWIRFVVDVPESGLYNIGIRFKQDYLRGFNATRRLYINGEVPFREVDSIHFPYHRNWQMNVLGNDYAPFEFYLEAGRNEITLRLTLGDVVDPIREIESIILELNRLYRTIITVTGTEPDRFRDYRLEETIPNLIEILTEQGNRLRTLAASIEEISGQRNEQTAVALNLAAQIDAMIDRPDLIPRRLQDFRANVGGLGTMILIMMRQPVTINYIALVPSGGEMPRAEAPWWRRIWHEIRLFIASFIVDFNTIGSIDENLPAIDVWINTGRDQAETLKAMIDDSFTPFSNVAVNFRLVGADIILPATLAGQGPDVSMNMPITVPVNFGIRNAVKDLATFPDFPEVATRFMESALVPFTFDGSVYALPEQQVFPMMFYRTDILEEMGLSVPNTWYDVFDMIPELQSSHLDFGFPVAPELGSLVPNQTFSMFLLQRGGEFYTEHGKRSAINSPEGIAAFRQWTDLFTLYRFPIEFNFVNRFRTGEMPIGIADYTTYNMLHVFAPEIRGFWNFGPVPGYVDAEGNIRREVPGGGTAVIIMESTDKPQESWEFLKWWTRADTQTRFGREMEGLLGPAARHPTANVEALSLLPWPVEDYRRLTEQWQWVHGIPEVPGGYFTARHLTNAFSAVINRGMNYRETLLNHVSIIDNEIRAKRTEFGLPID